MTVDVLYVVSTLRRSGPTNQLHSIIDNLSEEYNLNSWDIISEVI